MMGLTKNHQKGLTTTASSRRWAADNSDLSQHETNGPQRAPLTRLTLTGYGLALALVLPAISLAAPLQTEPPNAPGSIEARPFDAGGTLPAGPNRPRKSFGPKSDRDNNGLSDGLEDFLATVRQDEPVDVIVTYFGPGNASLAQQLVGPFTVTEEYSLIRGFAATMRPAQARALANQPNVLRVELDSLAYISLEAARMDFGVESLLNDSLTLGLTGAGVNVCVIDTGAFGGHEQFNTYTASSTPVGKFDASYFVGNTAGSYIETADSEDWNFASGAFTAEGWFRWDHAAGGSETNFLFSQWNSGGSSKSWLLRHSQGQLQFIYSTNGSTHSVLSGPWAFAADTWYHIAVDRDALGTVRAYVDGSVVLSSNIGAAVLHNSTASFRIGHFFDASNAANNALNGWADEVRITKGLARYAGAFAPPTTAFPSAAPEDPDFVNVVLLASLDSDPALDESASGQILAAGADASLDDGSDGSHSLTSGADAFLSTGEENIFVESKIAGFIDLIGDSLGVFQSEPYDDHYHGSHVAGIAVGNGTAGPVAEGGDPALASRFRGVAPGSALYVAKVLDAQGSGPNSVVVQGIEWCVTQGSNVINLSLGDPTETDGLDAMSQAVDAAEAAGVVVIAAMGNSGDDSGTVTSPGAAVGAITIGAAVEWSADPSDHWFSGGVYVEPFSSWGPTGDGRIKPDIVAPGSSILSSIPDVFASIPWLSCGIGCYDILSGTSMAAPFVTGTVALMLEADPTLTPMQVRDILTQTAQATGSQPVPNNEAGYGLLDAYAAVLQASGLPVDTPTAFPSFVIGTDSVADNGVTLIPIDVDDPTKPLAITVTIDGSSQTGNWNPDIEANLLDSNGVLVDASACPGIPGAAGCGLVGRKETVFAVPPLQSQYTLEVFPFDGVPNGGKGGTFTYEISNALWPVWLPNPLLADAGPDQTVTDSDSNGTESVALDGSNSTGDIQSYDWTENGISIASGVFPIVDLALGDHTITLTVSDDVDISSDVLSVTVQAGAPSGGIHVSDLDGTSGFLKGTNWSATVTVSVHDNNHLAVEGAEVSGSWSAGKSGVTSCITDLAGRCAVTMVRANGNQSSSTFVVDSISHATLEYLSSANHDPDGDSDGTAIVISNPAL